MADERIVGVWWGPTPPPIIRGCPPAMTHLPLIDIVPHPSIAMCKYNLVGNFLSETSILDQRFLQRVLIKCIEFLDRCQYYPTRRRSSGSLPPVSKLYWLVEPVDSVGANVQEVDDDLDHCLSSVCVQREVGISSTQRSPGRESMSCLLSIPTDYRILM